MTSEVFRTVFRRLEEQFQEDRNSHILWLPVFFILGVFLGFHCCRGCGFALALLLASSAAALVRTDSALGKIAVILIFLALGFLRAQRHIADYDFPVVRYNLGRVLVHGSIEDEVINFSKNGEIQKHLVINVQRIEALDRNSAFARDKNFKTPRRVRVRLRNPEQEIKLGPASLEVNLMPLEAKRFGSDFDLQMYFYFRKIGSMGYGAVLREQADGLAARDWRGLTFRQRVDGFRRRLALRIISVRPGPSTSMIATVLTGYRGFMNKNLLKLINELGLSSTISVSGVHMLILSQLVLAILKKILCRFETLAARFSVYRVAAAISILLNSLYLLVGGFSISSIRAHMVNVLGLLGLLLDRFGSPQRAVMLALFGMTFARPDLLFRIGFYMSFLSSLVMVAFVDYYYIHRVNEYTYFRGGLGENIRTNIMISLLVEMAVAPLEIYSFNTFSFYKVLAVLIINPFITFLAIPLGLVSLVLYPLGLERLLIYPLAQVTDVVIALIKFFARMPKSVIHVQSPSLATMTILVFGIVWTSLWTRSWRKLGLCLYLAGIVSILLPRRPDVIIDNGGGAVIFFDERGRAYAYGPSGRGIRNILSKFGEDHYVDLSLRRLDSCRYSGANRCSRLQIHVDSFLFQKNGQQLCIRKGKNFQLDGDVSNFRVLFLEKPSHGRPWFSNCHSPRDRCCGYLKKWKVERHPEKPGK
ncbi:MAG: ComEC/Rec2 family competence protein [Rickettsiales bacterium]|nr:ComEC/Rec2 family competence protein [Rickettsiales bacterium]